MVVHPIRSLSLLAICGVHSLLGRRGPTRYSANFESILLNDQHRAVGIHRSRTCAVGLRENADSRVDWEARCVAGIYAARLARLAVSRRVSREFDYDTRTAERAPIPAAALRSHLARGWP
jgi:hypothetical protein